MNFKKQQADLPTGGWDWTGQRQAAKGPATAMSVSETIARAFAPIAEAVERFASDHALRVDRCPRGNAGWELTRTHSSGGEVTLLLLYDGVLGLGIGSVWQFPCPEMSTLYSHFRAMRPCELTAEPVVTALDAELEGICQELPSKPLTY
jgi:hypothetical protein